MSTLLRRNGRARKVRGLRRIDELQGENRQERHSSERPRTSSSVRQHIYESHCVEGLLPFSNLAEGR
jgi:hypothetical protein